MPDQFVTRREASDIALAASKEASRETVTQLFASMGVNAANFDDMKRFREDLDYIREIRKMTNKMGSRFVLAIVSIVAGSLAISAWEFFKSVLNRGH